MLLIKLQMVGLLDINKITKEGVNDPIFFCFSKKDYRIFKISIHLDKARRDLSNGTKICTHVQIFFQTEFYELNEPSKYI